MLDNPVWGESVCRGVNDRRLKMIERRLDDLGQILPQKGFATADIEEVNTAHRLKDLTNLVDFQLVARLLVFFGINLPDLACLAFALAGGCPGRQLVMSGEGDGDAAIMVLGMLTGAAFAHNFAMASTPKCPAIWGTYTVMVGLFICIIMGFTMRKA